MTAQKKIGNSPLPINRRPPSGSRKESGQLKYRAFRLTLDHHRVGLWMVSPDGSHTPASQVRIDRFEAYVLSLLLPLTWNAGRVVCPSIFIYFVESERDNTSLSCCCIRIKSSMYIGYLRRHRPLLGILTVRFLYVRRDGGLHLTLVRIDRQAQRNQ